MKSKMYVICSSVALLHLVIGGAVMLGGCTSVQEDEPMPIGAYIPQQSEEPAEETAVAETDAGEPEVTAPETIIEPEVEPEIIVEPEQNTTPVKGDEPVKEPAVKPVPEKGCSGAAVKGDRTKDIEYTVQKGDSYWKIAKMYGVATADLVAYNTIAPEKLRPGQKIMIPAYGKKITPQVAPAKTQVKIKKSYAAIPADGVYVVQKGDSFYKIAQKFGLKAKDIADYNNLPLTKMLQVNQKLKLPAKNEAVKPAEKVVPAENTDKLPVEPVPVENATDDLDAIPPRPALDVEAPLTVSADSTAPAQPAELTTSETEKAAMTSNVIEYDTTVAELAENFGITEQQLREKNPGIAADGKIPSGTTININ